MQEFDRQVQKRDSKTGRIVHSQPYTEYVRSVKGCETNVFLERPKGSGNLWNESNEPMGRIDKSKPFDEQINPKAAHEVVKTPVSERQEFVEKLSEQEQKIKQLEEALIAKEAKQSVDVSPAPMANQKKGAKHGSKARNINSDN